MNNSSLSQKLADILTHYPKSCLLTALVLLSLLVPGLKLLQSDFGFRLWYQPNDPYIQVFDQFQRNFGNDDNVVVVMHSPDGIFDQDSIENLRELTDKIALVDKVIRVESLVNFNWVESDKDSILIEPFIPENGPEVPLTSKLLADKRIQALKHPMLPRYLISPDAKTSTVFARLQPAFEEKLPYREIIARMREVLESFPENHSYHITGTGAIPAALEEVTFSDLKLLLPLVFVLVFLILIYTFRSWYGLILPVVIIGTTVIATMGLSGWMDFKFDPMTSAIPEILVAICIADSVHILMSYTLFAKSGLNKIDAMHAALRKNIYPTFLTSISTTLGFLSVANSDILPIHNLGLLAGAGTMLAWVFSLLVIPSCVLLFVRDKGIPISKTSRSVVSPVIKTYVSFLQKHSISIVMVSICLTLSCTWLALQNDIDSDIMNYFSKDVPVRKANEFMNKNVGGDRGVEIVVDSKSADGVKNPEFLANVDSFKEWLKQQGRITKVMSMIDIVKDTNQALNEGDQDHFRIPRTQEAVAQQLFLYSMSLPPGMDMNYWSTFKSDKMRINVLWTYSRTSQMIEEINKIEAKARNHGLDARVTGKAKLMTGLNSHIVKTFFSSMAIAVLVISLMMVFIFRSLALGLVAMIPNVVPPLFGGALMFLLDKPIDTGTVLIISVCLGIAVDDTIHFLSNYNKQRKQGQSVPAALEAVLSHTGRALVFTTLILACGFGSFVFGQFIPSINFGMMTALVLIMALVTDLVLLPAILLLPGKLARNQTT